MEPASSARVGKCIICAVLLLLPCVQGDRKIFKKMRGSVVARGCLWVVVVMGRKLVVHDNGGG